MKTILYIAPKRSSFVNNDIKILQEEYNVLTYIKNWGQKINTPFLFFNQFYFILKNSKKISQIIISFAGYWSLIPVILGKIFRIPTYIIINGTDAVAFEEINYGNLRKPLLRNFIYLSYKWAYKLLPVSKSLMYVKNTYYSSKAIEQGVLAYFKDVTTPFKVIANGIDIESWRLSGIVKRESKSFMTVMGEGQEQVKGISLFVQLAFEFPNSKFSIVGVDSVSFETPENLVCLGRKKQKELIEIYHAHKFYMQLSNFEGFGVSLCEAMLCGCVPIVSNVNAMPEIVGDSGFIINSREDILEAVKTLRNAIYDTLSKENSNKSVLRIENKFSLNSRKEKLFSILNKG